MNIAIIMGGYSSEFEISLLSGNNVYKHLNRQKYIPYRIHICTDKWVYVDDDNTEYPVDKSDFTLQIDGNKIAFDCIFNAIHGTPGEDGLMQSYFKLLGIPQTSCDPYQAALTFNKRDLLSVLKPYGVQAATSYHINNGDSINEDHIVDRVGLPCFVKANKAGSSFGISKVYKKEHIEAALKKAFKEDDEVIIESFLEGTEVSVGVITYQGATKVLPITEIITENDFFDYEAKYEGKSSEVTPARITETERNNVIHVAKLAYEVLKMKGYTRSEFILIDEVPYMLEMNTTPGLTDQSILPQQAMADGISMSQLFESAIEEALRQK